MTASLLKRTFCPGCYEYRWVPGNDDSIFCRFSCARKFIKMHPKIWNERTKPMHRGEVDYYGRPVYCDL